MDCSTPGFPVLHYLLEFVQTHIRWIGDIIQPSHPLSPPSPPPQSFPASESFPMNWLFASGDQSIGASTSVCPKSGLISFRMDWFDLLAVQGILTSLLQHHNSKTSVLQHFSLLYGLTLSHPYMTTRETITLTMWTFVGKVMSLLFNTMSRFVTAFLPRSIFQFHGCSHCPQWFWSPGK